MNLATLNIHDFGIFIELEPDEEEKAHVRTKYSNCFANKINIS